MISVCVPVYNYGRFLRMCIDSVLRQTLADWELVISDDCSTDDTPEIAQSYAKADHRIRYFRNEHNLGMTPNLRRAASLGNGRYLKMLCADDWLAPSCLQTLFELMEAHSNAVLATSAETYCDASGQPLSVEFLFGRPVSVIRGETMLDRMARGHGFGGNSSFFIRASAYKQVGGYDESIPYASDYHLAARLCRIGDYLHSDEPLFYGRGHPHSSSSTHPLLLLDVTDWFQVPERVFRPRHLGDREWRRYRRLRARLTARYLLNGLLAHLRGRHEYARSLWKILWREGDLALGIPLLAAHAPARLLRRLTR